MEVSTLRVTDTGLRFGRDHTFTRWLRLGIALGGWNWIPKRPGASRVRQFGASDPVPPRPVLAAPPLPRRRSRTNAFLAWLEGKTVLDFLWTLSPGGERHHAGTTG